MIKNLQLGENKTNTYLIKAGNGYIIIDPAAEAEKIEKEAEGKALAVLLTHSHYDHIGAVEHLQKKGAKVYIHENEKKLLENKLAFPFLVKFDIKPDVFLRGGEVLEVGDKKIKVIHTPGHSLGSVCYIIDDNLFSGDTMFFSDHGRTDLPTGNEAQMQGSLEKLLALNKNYKVYPGHGKPTTLRLEKNNYGFNG